MVRAAVYKVKYAENRVRADERASIASPQTRLVT